MVLRVLALKIFSRISQMNISRRRKGAKCLADLADFAIYFSQRRKGARFLRLAALQKHCIMQFGED